VDDNPSICNYKEGSKPRRMATQFSYNYIKSLKKLHNKFSGNPTGIDCSVGVMYGLRFSALQPLETKAEWSDDTNNADKHTGLSFEYVTVNTG